jgi:hypothetical protein
MLMKLSILRLRISANVIGRFGDGDRLMRVVLRGV